MWLATVETRDIELVFAGARVRLKQDLRAVWRPTRVEAAGYDLSRKSCTTQGGYDEYAAVAVL
jgi:hypothetical protein